VVTDREGKVHHRTGYEGPEGKERYIPTISLTSKLDGVVGQCHTPADLLPTKTIWHQLKSRLGKPARQCVQVRKISPSTRFRTPYCPARTESVHRLSYSFRH